MSVNEKLSHDVTCDNNNGDNLIKKSYDLFANIVEEVKVLSDILVNISEENENYKSLLRLEQNKSKFLLDENENLRKLLARGTLHDFNNIPVYTSDKRETDDLKITKTDKYDDDNDSDWTLEESGQTTSTFSPPPRRRVSKRNSTEFRSPKFESKRRRKFDSSYVTHTIMVRGGFFPYSKEPDYLEYFSAFGDVEHIKMAKSNKLLFVKFKESKSAEKVLETSYHKIIKNESTNYKILRAIDM